MTTTTTTTATTACPSWCTTDHADDMAALMPEDRVPLHRAAGMTLGDPKGTEHEWAHVQLIHDEYDGQPMVDVCGQSLTLSVAAELAAVLPGLIARARQTE